MKQALLAILTTILFIPAMLSAQAIPPYGNSAAMPDSLPQIPDKSKDMPTKAGSFLVEGGAHIYYTSGKYYKAQDDDGDSKGESYAPWGIIINPSAEFFLFDKVAFGGTAKFEYAKLGADKRLYIGVGPIISLYAGTYPVIPFVSIFALYSHTNDYLGSTKSMYWTDMNMAAGAKCGLVYMISRQAGAFFDLRFTYESHTVQTPPATTQEKQKGWVAESFIGFKYFIF